jgi:hypothetical protein
LTLRVPEPAFSVPWFDPPEKTSVSPELSVADAEELTPLNVAAPPLTEIVPLTVPPVSVVELARMGDEIVPLLVAPPSRVGAPPVTDPEIVTPLKVTLPFTLEVP